ncbi:hypothetical protein ACIPSA_18450 [Streptomyces sp. NPDC086549]|uniref:hypothetical protein n=1 Tax=Streptomyces sp. NPDC086549 TaxID=3365752 RepID=UPI00382D06DF
MTRGLLLVCVPAFQPQPLTSAGSEEGHHVRLLVGEVPATHRRPELRPLAGNGERGLALGPVLVREDIDMVILPEEADLSLPADKA